MKITLFTLGALLCIIGVNAQSFTMNNGSVTTCNGYFYDSGGSAGDYKLNEDLIYTVNNPSGQGEFYVEFMEFALGDGDWLSVYEGQIDESSLIDTYEKNNLPESSLSTTKGRFIFVFHSDNTGVGTGWQAKIVCPEDTHDHNGDEHDHAMDVQPEGVLLIYTLKGLKSEADGETLNKTLSNESIIHKCEVHYAEQNIYVTASDISYTYQIKDLILLYASKYLQYEISVDYVRSTKAHTH